MNKDEIKKALECCSNPSINYCKDCPYANNGKFNCCNGKMFKDTLDLVTKQENEIDRLKIQLEQASAGIVNSDSCELDETNGVEEFAERVKEYINNKVIADFDDSESVKYYTIDLDEFESEIDELLKEYKQ